MKIGQYYKLPDGRKGLYVGRDEDGHNFAVRGGNDVLDLATEDGGNLEEYREPRVFEDEVRIYADHGSDTIYATLKCKDILANDMRYELVARMPFKLPEGSGL